MFPPSLQLLIRCKLTCHPPPPTHTHTPKERERERESFTAGQAPNNAPTLKTGTVGHFEDERRQASDNILALLPEVLGREKALSMVTSMEAAVLRQQLLQNCIDIHSQVW